MKANTENLRPIWLDNDDKTVKVIDQRRLPHELVILDLKTVEDVIFAIDQMVVRGAPLIGVTAAYGVFLAVLNCPKDTVTGDYLEDECRRITEARPTAVNLAWAVQRMEKAGLTGCEITTAADKARREAAAITRFEVDNCRRIGVHGASLIEEIRSSKNRGPVNILTHCNAGWLACIEYGTATAPVYSAAESGIDVHVWVDETRPLNQGARLTAWELDQRGIKHTLITDNAGGHLMQHGMVDMVIVGTDRTTASGDVANKIGTYLKALAAQDNQVPFYVALPSSTFDWNLTDGLKQIPIEKRDPDEVRFVQGWHEGCLESVSFPPQGMREAR